MNYFEYYNIPISFFPDLADLRNKYLIKSREVHPDFHADANEAEKEKILEEAGLNNLAYKTLADFESRVAYILELFGEKTSGESGALDPEFLNDVMEINEKIAELKISDDPSGANLLLKEVSELEKNLFNEAKKKMEKFGLEEEDRADILKSVKDYYLKNKYLLRIKENLTTFASQSNLKPR